MLPFTGIQSGFSNSEGTVFSCILTAEQNDLILKFPGVLSFPYHVFWQKSRAVHALLIIFNFPTRNFWYVTLSSWIFLVRWFKEKKGKNSQCL